MSQIFVIAGPPGVGKSTSGFEFVDADLEILNEDEMAFKYPLFEVCDFEWLCS
jgi:broad-specificity NMP kinase